MSRTQVSSHLDSLCLSPRPPSVHVSKGIYLPHTLILPSLRPQSITALCQWIWLLLVRRCASELHPLLWGSSTSQAVANRTNPLGLRLWDRLVLTSVHILQLSLEKLAPFTWVNRKSTIPEQLGMIREGHFTDSPPGVNENTTGIHVTNQFKELFPRP